MSRLYTFPTADQHKKKLNKLKCAVFVTSGELTTGLCPCVVVSLYFSLFFFSFCFCLFPLLYVFLLCLSFVCAYMCVCVCEPVSPFIYQSTHLSAYLPFSLSHVFLCLCLPLSVSLFLFLCSFFMISVMIR